MSYVEFSSSSDDKRFGYYEYLIDTLSFRQISAESHLTLENVRCFFKKEIDACDYYGLGALSDVSMAFFRINDAYFEYAKAKNASIAKLDKELVFYATAWQRFKVLDQRLHICIIWPIMSEKLYFVPYDMVDLWRYKKADDTIRLILKQKVDHFEANGHPFTEKITFMRVYHVKWRGLFKKKPSSIEVVKDEIRYTGDYDDRTLLCKSLNKTQEKEPFWLVRHSDEVKPLKGFEIPQYTEMGVGYHIEE